MYLVDTNIWLERLLDQERSAQVGQFLVEMPTKRLLMTDFTLHSIGIILSRFHRREVFIRFVDDVLIEGGVLGHVHLDTPGSQLTLQPLGDSCIRAVVTVDAALHHAAGAPAPYGGCTGHRSVAAVLQKPSLGPCESPTRAA